MHTALKCSVNIHILCKLSKFIVGISDISDISGITKWRPFLKAFMYSSAADVCYQLCINHGGFSLAWSHANMPWVFST